MIRRFNHHSTMVLKAAEKHTSTTQVTKRHSTMVLKAAEKHTSTTQVTNHHSTMVLEATHVTNHHSTMVLKAAEKHTSTTQVTNYHSTMVLKAAEKHTSTTQVTKHHSTMVLKAAEKHTSTTQVTKHHLTMVLKAAEKHTSTTQVTKHHSTIKAKSETQGTQHRYQGSWQKVRFKPHKVTLNIRKLGNVQKTQKLQKTQKTRIRIFSSFEMFGSAWGGKKFETIRLFQPTRDEINESPKWFVTPWYFICFYFHLLLFVLQNETQLNGTLPPSVAAASTSKPPHPSSVSNGHSAQDPGEPPPKRVSTTSVVRPPFFTDFKSYFSFRFIHT